MSHDPVERTTLSGRLPKQLDGGAPDAVNTSTGMHRDYWILSERERAKGFVRPVRNSYVHLTCGVVTRMAVPLAETYARDPAFYGATFCCACRAHFPVREFLWDGTSERVGS